MYYVKFEDKQTGRKMVAITDKRSNLKKLITGKKPDYHEISEIEKADMLFLDIEKEAIMPNDVVWFFDKPTIAVCVKCNRFAIYDENKGLICPKCGSNEHLAYFEWKEGEDINKLEEAI